MTWILASDWLLDRELVSDIGPRERGDSETMCRDYDDKYCALASQRIIQARTLQPAMPLRILWKNEALFNIHF